MAAKSESAGAVEEAIDGSEFKERRPNRWLRKVASSFSKRRFNDSRVPPRTISKEELGSTPFQPLNDDEIRLVQFQPSTCSEESIACKIGLESLKTAKYEALSYEWGSASSELEITMMGKVTLIRENLWWALHHLQLETEVSTIWIDAICINQNDTAERNHQVALMGKIYSSASRCVGWIGREQLSQPSYLHINDCRPAIDFIGRRYEPNNIEEPVQRVLSSRHTLEHDSLEFLCRRKYWSRLWIIQEILLCSEVIIQCGVYQIPWQELSHIFSNLKTYIHASYQFSISTSIPFKLNQQRIARWHETAPQNEHSSTEEMQSSLLADLVLQFKGSECENPLDAVFGLLGLARECCQQAVPAEYSSTPDKICTALLIHYIVTHLDLTSKLPDAVADMRGLCDKLVVKSKMKYSSHDDDAMVELSSVKALLDGRRPENEDHVLWVVSALELKLVACKAQDVEQSAVRLDDSLLDTFIRKVYLSKPKYYHIPQLWRNSRSQNNKSQPTHVFLTEMGYSGITTSDVKLGSEAIGMSRSRATIKFGSWEDYKFIETIAMRLDRGTTFLDLLSWVLYTETRELVS